MTQHQINHMINMNAINARCGYGFHDERVRAGFQPHNLLFDCLRDNRHMTKKSWRLHYSCHRINQQLF